MKEQIICALWRHIAAQDAQALAGYFTEDALILWPNSSEAFTLPEYVRANCEYPGQWQGLVEQVSPDGGVSVARVWTEGAAFRVVSFYQWRGDRLVRMEEYWGDIGPAPQWRQELGVGRTMRADEAVLPAAAGLPSPLGRCGFYCGGCPSYAAGQCAGCDAAHRSGDCFTRDCTKKRGLRLCTLCPEFPCLDLLEREKATVLDKQWLQWQHKKRI